MHTQLKHTVFNKSITVWAQILASTKNRDFATTDSQPIAKHPILVDIQPYIEQVAVGSRFRERYYQRWDTPVEYPGDRRRRISILLVCGGSIVPTRHLTTVYLSS